MYFDENVSRMILNYRWAFIQLAQYYYNSLKDSVRSAATLDRMEAVIPRSKVGLGWEMTTYIASFYHRLGRDERFREMAAELEPVAKKMIAAGNVTMSSYDNPYSVLLEIYDARRDYKSMLALLHDLEGKFPGDPGIKQRIREIEALGNGSTPVTPDSSH